MLRPVLAICALFVLAFVMELASRPAPPVASAEAFLDALHYRECDAMLAHLSAEARAEIVRAASEMTAPASYEAAAYAPPAVYCRPSQLDRFRGLSAYGMRLASVAGDEAIVNVERREATAYLFPGFWATEHRVTVEQMRLVREAGRWVVSLP